MIPGFKIAQSVDGKSAVVVDTAEYDALGTKEDFSSRLLVIVDVAGVARLLAFPYTGTPDNIQDELSIPDFLTGDKILDIKLQYVKDNAEIIETPVLHYISTSFSNLCIVSEGIKVKCNCVTEESTCDSLVTLESARYLHKIGMYEKAQKLLDYLNSICGDNKGDCGCNN